MSRLSRTFLFVLLWIGSCTMEVFGQKPIVFRPWVLRHFALMYREFSTEFLFCLYGPTRPDSMIVELAVLADVRPSRSTPDDVTPVQSCWAAGGGITYFGDAHSHPHESAALNGQRFHIDPNADLCYLSHPDQESFREDTAASLAVVVCGFGQFMVWRRGEPTDKQGTRCIYDVEFPNECRAGSLRKSLASP